MAIKEIALAALAALFADYDPVATEKLLTPDYIQHNPAVPTGRAAIIGFLPGLKESGITVKTHRLIAEGDIVVAHSSYSNAQAAGGENLVVFDVFRIENGKIAEHWDNLTAKTPPNPSGHTQTDGPTEITDLDKTADNKKLVADFIDAILVNGKFDMLGAFIDGDNYTQHNSDIADGLDGLGVALEAMAAQGITVKYNKVHKVVAEGNFVLTMSEGTFGNKPTAFYDLFRVDGGKIVEHWDILSEIPAESANDNGKF